jgi:DNA-binding NtrC family response regulator
MLRSADLHATLPPVQQTHTILVASNDPQLADTRKSLLEAAGHSVIAVREPSEVGKMCSETPISLLIIGYSVPPAKKRHIWLEARNKCHVPILELHRSGESELIPEEALFLHEAHAPDDFLNTVQNILRK